MLPDYREFESAIGLDWYEVDPNLRLQLDRYLPDPDDREFAEKHVAEYGELVGKRIAPRAEITDKHGPQLRRYDEWGQEVNEIVHHPTWLENKADLIRTGFISLPANAGRDVPGVVTAARAYLVSQAEIAIYCGLGMSAGAADVVERLAPDDARAALLPRLHSLDPDEAWEGGMFLTERPGGAGRRRMAHLRREVLLLQRRRRSLHRPRPPRGRARRQPGSGHLHRPARAA